MPLSQINCHNFFFFKFLPKILATWLPQYFFFLPFSATWLPQFTFSLSSLPYNFGILVATIGFPLGTPSSTSTSGTSHSLGQQLRAARISVISLPKFNFFSLLHHITYLYFLSYFFLQFWQHHCRNSLSFLIFPNNFEQYLYHQ